MWQPKAYASFNVITVSRIVKNSLGLAFIDWRYDVNRMRQTEPTHAETIAALAARCDGPNQFEQFDRAVRQSLAVPKAAVVKEEARQKKLRAGRRAKKTLG